MAWIIQTKSEAAIKYFSFALIRDLRGLKLLLCYFYNHITPLTEFCRYHPDKSGQKDPPPLQRWLIFNHFRPDTFKLSGLLSALPKTVIFRNF